MGARPLGRVRFPRGDIGDGGGSVGLEDGRLVARGQKAAAE